ncbi:hypothetical protein ACFYPC_07095 [Streptomyces sp. NPDC005808]|uniref:hypothetical protein n=1 Tax=Streptomyces sp. NPDC005808 TaxID=3364734 RepID=UPI003685D379
MPYKWCQNCGRMRDFRHLVNEAERAATRAAVGQTNVDAYIRCAHEGCRRVQRRGRSSDGGTLPEELRIPTAE